MTDPMLQKRYCVAAMQHRVSYNVFMTLPLSEPVTAMAVGLTASAPRIRHIHLYGLPIVMVIVLVIAGIFWVRQRSRASKVVPDRPDDWPPRHPESRPENEKDGPPQWQ
jgi:hypothetical protein